MSSIWLIFLATVFLAVIVFVWGLHAVWRSHWGRENQRLAHRWQSVASPRQEPTAALESPNTHAPANAWLKQNLLRWPGGPWLHRFVSQAGLALDPNEVLLIVVAPLLLTLGMSIWLELGMGASMVLMGLMLSLPWVYLLHRRGQRMAQIELHLPDVLDLIARSMQAGHAFSSALKMAASDAKPPLSTELRRVFDEINYGLDMRQALSDMAERVASDDVRFFVIAVLIQHETGGNLAEILKNTANLIRERQKLRGVIRVLSGEGRVSAWILSLLPVGLAAALNLINPEFMSTLWTSPLGLQMLYVCMTLMLVGMVWMWRLIDIRI